MCVLMGLPDGLAASVPYWFNGGYAPATEQSTSTPINVTGKRPWPSQLEAQGLIMNPKDNHLKEEI